VADGTRRAAGLVALELCAHTRRPRQGVADMGDGYVTLLGLISHEYFHTWNVKRLQPRDFERIDYGRENHTRLPCVFEGFPPYYDPRPLLRAGLAELLAGDDARDTRIPDVAGHFDVVLLANRAARFTPAP